MLLITQTLRSSTNVVNQAKRLISYKKVHYIDSLSTAKLASQTLIDSDMSVIDTEGVQLGRFGQLCLLQAATRDHLFLCDVLKPDVLPILSNWLEGPSIKIMHDCREDSSALYNQHNIILNNVFDCQIAYADYLNRTNQKVYHIGLSALCTQVGASQVESLRVKQDMSDDITIWRKRPIAPHLLKYAAQDVSSLWSVYDALIKKPYICNVTEVIELSHNNIEYGGLNVDIIKKPSDSATVGTQLYGFLASIANDKLIFKLNCGRTGMVLNDLARRRFSDVKIGDIVPVSVVSSSSDGSVIYLERYNPFRHDQDGKMKSILKKSRRFETARYGRKLDPLIASEMSHILGKNKDDDEEIDIPMK